MNYPPIPPKTPPRRRPTYGEYNDETYEDDYRNPSPNPTFPRRKPVGQSPAASSPSPDTAASRSSRPQPMYGARQQNDSNGQSYISSSPDAQRTPAGYVIPGSRLVYPETFEYEPSPPPPPLPPKQHYDEPEYDYGDPFGDIPTGLNDVYRPLPSRPSHRTNPSANPPRLHIHPSADDLQTSYQNEHYSNVYNEYEERHQDPYEARYDIAAPSTEQSHYQAPSSSHYLPPQDPDDFLDMPTPVAYPSKDALHPLPPTPKSPPYTDTQSPDTQRMSLSRQGSGHRPDTRSSTSSMYSYSHERPFDDDYAEYPSPSAHGGNSSMSGREFPFGRTGTILNVPRKPSYTVASPSEFEEPRPAPPPPPPPPPPHSDLSRSPTTPYGYPSQSAAAAPPIYRTRTDPSSWRYSANDAPTIPPKIPLSTDGSIKPPVPAVNRSQSSSAAVKPPSSRIPMKLATDLLELPHESPLSPTTDSKTFPLSSKDFQRCKEPWSLSSLRMWIQTTFGQHVSMETISLALQGLFTHHVSTLSTLAADKLAAQVGTTWIREGVLFEPTVANTALWNPLSTLEMSFTPFMAEGVLPTLTGKGCYSSQCTTTPLGVGRCYSHLCSRTLTVKKTVPEPLPTPTVKGSDWSSFWQLDSEFIRTMDKREVKRQNNIFEFIQGEEEYVTDLNTMVNLFQKQLIASSTSSSTPGTTPATPAVPVLTPARLDTFVTRVFANVKPILEWQTKKLLTPLRERQAQQGPVITGVGDIVLEWVRGCESIYADYASGYPMADHLVREETANNPAFTALLDKLQQDPICRRLSFNHFLQIPTRKIQRVLLIFGEMIKHTEETNRDREILEKANVELKEIVHICDDRSGESEGNMKRMELEEKLVFKSGQKEQKVDLGLSEPTRKVINRGDVLRKSENKLEWLDIHVILLDNFLIMTKRKREKGTEKLLVSKKPIPLDLLQLEGMTEDAVAKAGVLGTLTTIVSTAPGQPLARAKTSKPLQRTDTTTTGGSGSELTLVTSLTSPQTDKTLIYPFRITHLSASGDTYILYADSAKTRQTWIDEIMNAKRERAIVLSHTEPFQARIVAESVFADPQNLEQSSLNLPPLIELSTMHRAIQALRAEPFGSRTLRRADTIARVNCAKSFIAPEHSDFPHQRLVAVGTDDGVYIGYVPEASGLCTKWHRALTFPQTTQIDVLEEFGVFLVLTNKELLAFSLINVIPPLSEVPGTALKPTAPQPQRLSGSHSVGFFATGKLKDRMLVIYKKRGNVNSVFRCMEPVVGRADTNRRNLFSRRRAQTEFFREYDDFFIATDCYGLFTFKNTIAIPTQKGFEVLSLDSKDAPITIPDLSGANMATLASQVNGTKALGMYRLNEKEFLLCYDECALYVDQHGEISRSKVISWHGKPKATQVIDGKYVIAFDPSFVEIWRCGGDFQEGGVSLVQIIPGRDVRMIGKEEKKADLGLGPGTGYYDRVYVAMGHPERGDRQIVVELSVRMF